MKDVTLRQLRGFEALAAELNFGRAAASVHLTQPALSLSIRRLERSLGVALFTRTTRHVELTPAGSHLLAKLLPALAALEAALDVAEQWADGTRGVLRIGYLIGAGLDRLPRLLRAFTDKYPDIRVETVEFDFSEPTAGLRAGKVQVAVLRPPIDLDDVDFLELSQEGWVACLPQDHALARRRKVRLAEVLTEPIVAAPESAGAWRDYWIAAGYRGPEPARVVAEAATFEAEFSAVAQGKGISITVEAASRYFRRPDIRFVPISDAPPSSVSLAWHRDNVAPALARFIEVARQRQ